MSDTSRWQVRVVAAALGIDADGECLPATFYIEAAIAQAVSRFVEARGIEDVIEQGNPQTINPKP